MKRSMILFVALLCAAAIAIPALADGKSDTKKSPKKDYKKKTYSGSKQKINLSATIKDGKVHLVWSKSTKKEFRGYKVVHSTSNKSPKYPKDKYVKWITKREVNTIVHKPKSDKTNYYRVCVLPKRFDYKGLNYCGISNVVTVKGDKVSNTKYVKDKPYKKEKDKCKDKDAGKCKPKPKSLKCHKCKKTNPKGSKFCNGCGKHLGK